MTRFFERLRSRRDEPTSGKVAKERLRLVLTHDRAGISPTLLDTLKDEIIAVISNHIPIDVGGVRVTISQAGHESSLVADIPLSTRRRSRKR